MIPVLSSGQMRAADRAAIAGGVSSLQLMENAATALSEEITGAYPGWRRVVVVCGPGNNGGDGLAAARLLARRGLAISIFTLSDLAGYRGDAAENLSLARAAGLEFKPLTPAGASAPFARELSAADGVVDALFGTGLSRGLSGPAARVVSGINSAGRPVVAADLPSGLSGDSGELLGPCVVAARTVAFAAPKRCHVLFPARGRCGRIVVRDIGIPREILLRQKSRLAVTSPEDISALLPPRPPDSHKADFGRLAIVAGSRGKAGAAVLAARGALRSGVGLVTVFCPASIEATVVGALPETMTHALPEAEGALAAEGAAEMLEILRDLDAAVVGPGLGTAPGTVTLLERLLAARVSLVCDADALNAFAGNARVFSRRRAATVLTPHPGEAGRLLGTSSREVQRDRLAAASALARRARAVVLLKGAASLTATPKGRITVNPTGTALMSSAGSGDVLAGSIGALLAGGIDPEPATFVAAYLHGAAGERLAETRGDAGLLARELADTIPVVRAALCAALGQRRETQGEDEE
ncbi:MAG TPA: NAD(P)H-hydrate dehydratase [Thermoanaerobaculia bacterium]|nr:NAD(P)H-hydrate dehydratase [Thermoanaerobaculia bacterium]